MRVTRTIRKRLWLLVLTTLLGLVGASSASAQPVWRIDSVANTTAQPGGTITYYVEVVNVGSSDADGSSITTTISFPAGVTGVSGTGREPGFGPLPACTATDGSSPVTGEGTIQCVTTNPVTSHGDPGAYLRYTIVAQVGLGVAAPSTVTTLFSTTGGGSSDAGTAVDPTRIDNPPGFGVDAFDGQIVADQAGDPLTQAGGHPYALFTAIDFNTVANPLPLLGNLWPAEATKDALVDLPPGLVGSVTGVDQCTSVQLAHSLGNEAKSTCPSTSQIGTTLVRLNGFPALPNTFGPIPVFNMVPPPNAPAQFGFNVAGTVVTLTARARSATDYGISVDGNDIPEGLAIAGTSFTFWGVPSDPSHDNERACPGESPPWGSGPTCQSGAPARAFFRLPTSCSASAGSPVQGGLATNLSIDSWDHPGARDANGDPVAGDPNWQKATWVTHAPPGYPAPPPYGPHALPTGCEKVPFTPALSLLPTAASRASSPTPFTVDLSLPQSDDPTTIGEGDLKQAVVKLPVGVRVSPSSADGLGACSPAQIGLHSVADASCPDSSKVATVEITTPLLPQKLTGAVYLATPNDNPFDALIAIYIVVKAAGVNVKLAGHVETNTTTGQIMTTFDNLPQLPFSLMHLEFNGGPRAPLTTPSACGTYTTHSVLTSWSGKTVNSDSDFTVDANSDGTSCAPLGFVPGFSADSVDPVAGGASAFELRLTRSDRDQDFSSLSVELPTGAAARLGSVPLCPDAAASAGTCQDVSKVGSVTVGAGAGSNPFYITTGRAYLTGPYKGAPFGLSVVVPAVAGPFDLGNVVVRSAIDVDRHTAQAHVVADPLPTILQGIPLDVRDLRVAVDRPGFFVNPTNCASKSVNATVGSTEGTIAHVSEHFQVTNCAALPLAPKLSFTVGSKRHTRGGVSTPLTATLTQTPGQSALRAVSVTLPTTLNALLPVVNRACTRAAFDAGRCTSRAKIGTAVAVTPLLRDPLRGSVYFVKNGHTLPDLVVALRGQVAFDLFSKVSIPGGRRLATKFDTIPDVPLSRFTLRIVSGNNGPIGTISNLCTTKARAATAAIGFRGQNGALLKVNQRLHINGCPKAAKARR